MRPLACVGAPERLTENGSEELVDARPSARSSSSMQFARKSCLGAVSRTLEAKLQTRRNIEDSETREIVKIKLHETMRRAREYVGI